jgi:hypothetical protein
VHGDSGHAQPEAEGHAGSIVCGNHAGQFTELLDHRLYNSAANPETSRLGMYDDHTAFLTHAGGQAEADCSAVLRGNDDSGIAVVRQSGRLQLAQRSQRGGCQPLVAEPNCKLG